MQMGTDELNNLVKEVKETVATGVHVSEDKKQFTAVDMWQIKKHMKTSARSARRWNLN
jgi:hypothetical protein